MFNIKNTITGVKFNNKTGILVVTGKLEGNISNLEPKILLQEQINSEALFFPKVIVLKVDWDGENFSAILDFHDKREILSSGEAWDFYVKVNNDKYKLDMLNCPSFQASYYPFEDTLFQAVPYVTRKNNLSIWVKPKEIEVKVHHVELRPEGLILQVIIVNYSPHTTLNYAARLVFNKIEEQGIGVHNESIKIEAANKELGGNLFSFFIAKRSVFGKEVVKPGDTWKGVIDICDLQGNYVRLPLIIPEICRIDDQFSALANNRLCKAKFLIDDKNSLMLKVEQTNISMQLERLSYEVGTTVALSGSIQGLANLNEPFQINRLYLRLRSNSNRLIPYVIELPFELSCNNLSSKFSLKSVLNNYRIDEGAIWGIYVEVLDKETGSKGEFAVYTQDRGVNELEYEQIIPNYDIKPCLVEGNSLAFKVRKKVITPVTNPIKIAVCGSCYSRVAFSSNTYFNPDYKEKYDVVHTQFHSSVVSVMSKPTKFPIDYFLNYTQTQIDYIKDDFEKGFFEKIELLKPEFLIMDFYADVFSDLIIFDEDHIITGSYYVRDSEYLYEISRRAEILTRENVEIYLSYWHKAMESFSRKIQEYIPQERIILQRARAIETFYDKDKKVKKFKNDRNFIERSNTLFEYMENYLLHLMPNIQVIDLTQFGYIGQYDFPYGGESVNHYEPNYYKEMLKKVDDIVVRTLNSTNMITVKGEES
ncbi:DUF6270 domain-containing protein [Bacillus wiedmannii]|uniref:DUF6270 domain-containing protein n=1 Tax=Bacillus wiedmannii TaxID=1890302 RepID=UPI002E1A40D3|nr:DUF6270 domain-containing protein [Bacillus wiedmannii]